MWIYRSCSVSPDQKEPFFACKPSLHSTKHPTSRLRLLTPPFILGYLPTIISPSFVFSPIRSAPLRPASHPSLTTKPPNSIMSSPPYPPPPYQRYASPPSYSLSDDERRRRETSRTAALLRWFQLKRYQYEVTFSLYMLTPTEKFIFSEWKQISPSYSVIC